MEILLYVHPFSVFSITSMIILLVFSHLCDLKIVKSQTPIIFFRLKRKK